MGLSSLGYLNGQPARPCPKPAPAVLAKIARKAAKKADEATFRAGVWSRDQSRSRASGKPLARSGSDYARVGEVHHVLKRSTAPELIYSVENGILLSKQEHILAETACPNDPSYMLLDIRGPEDRGKAQEFIWRDKDAQELKRRVG